MRWLRAFFHVDDPIVKLTGGLSEPDALMRRELLENKGVPAMVRNTAGDSVAYGATPVLAFDLYVKESDVERAKLILGPMMDGDSGDEPESNGHGEGYTR